MTHVELRTPRIHPGAPEAVLDWGGKDLRRLTIFFCQELISGVASFLVWGGEGYQMYRQKIKVLALHIGRAEVFVIMIFITYC